MAYDGWIEFGGVEFINLSRTAQLAAVMGIETVWTSPEDVAWIEDALAASGYSTGYDVIANAPWYDANYPASSEFAGLVPLSITGLDDSSSESSTIEYITDGGTSGKARSKTLPLVANVAVIASTARGADYGKRWMDRVLSAKGSRTFCRGSELRYFQYEQGAGLPTPPIQHRRDVSLTRGSSVTRKRASDCSATWLVTFTWTANDPFEYGEAVEQFTGLGVAVTSAAGAVVDSGSVDMIEESCPAYDYAPIYDPLHPALVEPPTVPDFYPDGWDFPEGAAFKRYWARLAPVEPSALDLVPKVVITAPGEARMLRVQVWPGDAAFDSVCDPLWTVVATYVPASVEFTVDGEEKATYVWDGFSPTVRRADSLAFGSDARPIEWHKFNDPSGLLVTFDVRTGYASGTPEVAISLVPKSD